MSRRFGVALAAAALAALTAGPARADDISDLEGLLSEQVVSSVRISGRGKTSGAPVALTLISVGKLRDGMVYRLRNYPDMATALEAVGLSG